MIVTILKFFKSLEEGPLHFHFVLDLTNDAASSGQLVCFLRSSSLCSQRTRRELRGENGHLGCKATSQSPPGTQQPSGSPPRFHLDLAGPPLGEQICPTAKVLV